MIKKQELGKQKSDDMALWICYRRSTINPGQATDFVELHFNGGVNTTHFHLVKWSSQANSTEALFFQLSTIIYQLIKN
ncbi:hypothetical protein [Fulvivirga imtechensis]|uniref:hypothetical protein n=1 Tax=Fulvivirga imtechensis TaxID=881893 RepID=UPI00058C6970|nr:hypothetical protein [Fulvivirga imtechensis]